MPKISERQVLLAELDNILKMLAIFGDENTEDADEILELKAFVYCSRFINLRQHVRKNKAMNELLWSYGEREFKQLVRMKKSSFLKLLGIISKNPIFGQPDSRHKQAPVWVQLLVVLQRLGCDGNGVSVGRCGMNSGFSVGSVCKFSERVFRAILSLQSDVIFWPDFEERRIISDWFDDKFGLPGVCGILDGTPAVLYQRPGYQGEIYWTRKSHYAINVQLIGDHRKKIRHYVVGWPGSCYDNDVFEKSDIAKNPEQFLSPGEFLMADSGYALRSWVCVPYRQPQASIPVNKLFNELYSKGRCLIEHLNGILKMRWQSLKGIRTQVKRKEDFKLINEHIVVCLILHNLLIAFNDEWEAEPKTKEPNMGHLRDCVTGHDLRSRVHNYLLTWHFARM